MRLARRSTASSSRVLRLNEPHVSLASVGMISDRRDGLSLYYRHNVLRKELDHLCGRLVVRLFVSVGASPTLALSTKAWFNS